MKARKRPLLVVLSLFWGACSVTEGDLLQTKRSDLGMPDAAPPSPPPLCTTELLSSASCTAEAELLVQADARCAAHGFYRVDLALMSAGCSAGSARSASATCCPFTRPPHCTLEQQRPADQVCRSGLELIAYADKACAVVSRRALIQDLLDYCQSGLWLGVSYWCCE